MGFFLACGISQSFKRLSMIPYAHCSLLQVVLEWVLGTQTPLNRIIGALGDMILHNNYFYIILLLLSATLNLQRFVQSSSHDMALSFR